MIMMIIKNTKFTTRKRRVSRTMDEDGGPKTKAFEQDQQKGQFQRESGNLGGVDMHVSIAEDMGGGREKSDSGGDSLV